MAYAIEYFNTKTNKHYLGNDTFNTEEDATNYFKSIQYRLSGDVVFSRIVDIDAEEEKKEGPVKMSYKIKLHNILTGEDTLSNEAYDTQEAAAEAWQKALLAGEIHSGLGWAGIVEVNESKLKYDLTDDGKGKKYDSGKSMVGTLCRVFPRALLGVGQCIEFGTHKYPDPKNWVKVKNAFNRYQDSMMRHYLKFLAGQEKDSETKLLHLKHMVWNALAVLELYLMENEDETLFD